jgi:2'-hydroxyisoflavone reductase
MKILIVGGSRFVGPLVIEALLKRKHKLTVFNRGRIRARYDKEIVFIKGDRDKDLKKIQEHFEVVIDMCAYTGSQTRKAIENLSFDFYINFGTAASYRKTEIFPLRESSPLGRWPLWGEYNSGKVDCERVLKKSKIEFATIRPVYILGARNYINRENFIYSKIRKGETITIPGNGQAVVQFTFAQDVANVLLFLAENKLTGTFNCAGDDLVTLQGLVEIMAKIVGRKARIAFNSEADGGNYKIEEFPFANENFMISNIKLEKVGFKFLSLEKTLRLQYKEFYEEEIR